MFKNRHVGVEMDQKDDRGKIAGMAVKEEGVGRILEGMWDKRFLYS